MNDYENIRQIFERDGYICQSCGKTIVGKQPQRAHILSQGKGARKIYPNTVIDSGYNAKATCSLKCNDKLAVNIATRPVLCEKLVDAILSEDMAAIDELLKHRRKIK